MRKSTYTVGWNQVKGNYTLRVFNKKDNSAVPTAKIEFSKKQLLKLRERIDKEIRLRGEYGSRK